MRVAVVRGIDLLALAGALVAAVMVWAYIALMHHQGNDPAAWVIVVLALGTLGCLYASWFGAPLRKPVVFASGGILYLLGLLAILTIGFPILVAATLAVASGVLPEESYR
jgi:hypothetical protein